MRKTSLALAALSLSMIWAAAEAGHHGKHGAKVLIKTADADESGDVSAEEWQAFLDGLTVDENGAVDLTALAEQLPVRPTTRGQRQRARHRGVEPPTAEEALARALDHDGDGTVTIADLEALHDELDQDDDGVLDETDRPERSEVRPMGRRARKAGRFVLTVADADESGDVTADEWASFKDALGADENGVFEAMTLLALLPEPEEGSRLAEKTDEERAAKLARIVDRDRDDLLELLNRLQDSQISWMEERAKLHSENLQMKEQLSELSEECKKLREAVADLQKGLATTDELEKVYWTEHFAAAPIPILRVQANGEVADCNEAFEEAFGYPKSQIQSLKWQEITHPDDLEADLEMVKECLAGTRDRYTMQKRYRKRLGGDADWIALTLHVVAIRRRGEFRYFNSFVTPLQNEPVS